MSTWDGSLTGVVTLPDGRLVRGRALRGAVAEEESAPEFGVYLTAKPHTELGWESRWVCWPDFRLPRSPDEAILALEEAHELSARVKVEVACDGGTGRTGSALAILARLAGVPPQEAVTWVRAHYRARAVETPWQRRFVRRVDLAR